ncbi:MAG: hypothetical protein K1X54_10520 [Flavobacteriales bacterium]|nr:hypothetical protein [Flavobacteriales bacterium]
MSPNKYLTLLLLFTLSCSSSKHISTLVSSTYDEVSNQTTYNVLPLGSVVIPGEWTKTTYNDVSNQQNFTMSNGVSTAIAINQASIYPFYQPQLSTHDLVREMYKWDAQYFAEQLGTETPILLEDSTQHFIIWQILSEPKGIDNYYLFGCENGIIFTVFLNAKEWDIQEKMNFLQTAYRNKTVGNCCN